MMRRRSSVISLTVLVMMLVGLSAATPVADFPPPICDETGILLIGEEWRYLPGQHDLAYTTQVSWLETSPNPLITDLDVTFELIVPAGTPWTTMYAQIKDGVDKSGGHCEAEPVFSDFQNHAEAHALTMTARVDVGYFLCISGHKMSKLGDQQFNFTTTLQPVVRDGIARVSLASSFTHSPLPNNVVATYDAIGVIGGALLTSWAGPGAIFGAALGGRAANDAVNGTYEAQLDDIRRIISGVQEPGGVKLPPLNLIADYDPTYLQPFLTSGIAPKGIGRLSPGTGDVSLLIHFPLRVRVPNAEMCTAKQKIASWFEATNAQVQPNPSPGLASAPPSSR